MQTVEFRALVARQLALMSGSDVAAIDAGLADPLGQGFVAQSLGNKTLQVRPSGRQSPSASCFCSAVNWRLVLVGLVIAGLSEGHGVSHIDLFTDSG